MSKPIDQLALENIQAFNEGDWNRLKNALATDVLYSDMASQRRLQGVGQFVEEYQNWKAAAPDCKGTVKNAFVAGNKVIVEVQWKGTNTGPLGKIPATGKSWDIPGCQVITIANDKITELNQYYDMLSILQQLGVTGK